MALETLKTVSAINGVTVHRNNWKSGGDRFIEINESDNAITFKIQNGPINENGINGCQVTDIIATARIIIDELNKRFSCRENSITITKLDEALMWQTAKTLNREKREVEGYNIK